MSPARRLRDALEPLAALSFYSDPSTDAYASVGLEAFQPAYFWSRSSVLGEAPPEVVAAAFGVWEPGLVRRSLEQARQVCSLADIRRATDEGAGAAARQALDGVPEDEVREVVGALRRGVDGVDLIGRPLLAGHRALGVHADPHTALWRVATAWRELRGDSHVAACVAAGLDGVQANVLNELQDGYALGEYTSTREWSDDRIQQAAGALRERGLLEDDALADAGRSFREDIENRTDQAVAPALEAVGDELAQITETAASWAQRVLDLGWFPTDDRKRAAG